MKKKPTWWNIAVEVNNQTVMNNGLIKMEDKKNEANKEPLDLSKIIEIPRPRKPKSSWLLYIDKRLKEITTIKKVCEKIMMNYTYTLYIYETLC